MDDDGSATSAVQWDPSGHLLSIGLVETATATEMLVVRHARTNGAALWSYSLTIDAPTYQASGSLATDGAGSVFTASRQRERYGRYTGVVAKLSLQDGSELWRVEMPDHGFYSLAVDSEGDLVAAGGLSGSGTGQVLVAAKLSGATGVEIWRRAIPGAFEDRSEFRDVVIDQNDDVVAVGALAEDAELAYPDFVAFKLSGEDGSDVWQRTIPSIAGHGGQARSVALDEGDDVIVGGFAVVGTTWCDVVVAKLAGPTGSELWRSAIAEGGCSGATAVSVDPNGDVIATGGDSGTTLFSVFKFRGDGGSLLWRHDIPNAGICTGGGCAGAQALATNSAGDAYAVGSLAGSDMAITKLSGLDGTEDWLRVIDSDGCDDGAHAVALDGTGVLAVGAVGFARIGGQCAWPAGSRRMVLTFDGATGVDFTPPPILCGDGALAGSEECDDGNTTSGDGCSADCLVEEDSDLDGVPDVIDNCPVDGNPDQADPDADGLGDSCDPFPADPDNEQAQCEADLNQCLETPLFEDDDGDGEHDYSDGCPGTPMGAPIDAAGCSIEQFCDLFDVSTGLGLARCLHADWQNNAPLGARDCRGIDLQCVPGPRGCGLGFELVLLLPPLMWRYGRRS